MRLKQYRKIEDGVFRGIRPETEREVPKEQSVVVGG
jgi:hypothetical protein